MFRQLRVLHIVLIAWVLMTLPRMAMMLHVPKRIVLNRAERRALKRRVRTVGRVQNAGASLVLRRAWFAVSTTTNLNSLYNLIYEDALFVAREQALMPSLVTIFNGTGYADRKVSIFSQSTVQKVAEGVDYSNAATLSKSVKATFTPEEAMSQFVLTDRMLLTDDVDSIQQAAAMELGSGIAEQVDKDLLSKFSSFTAGQGFAGSALTLERCAAGMAVLRNGKSRGQHTVVLHPYQWQDIWVELGKPSTSQVPSEAANAAMNDYWVTRALAADWYVSANITVNASDDAYGAVFAREALALDVREDFSVRPERDESLRATELNGHMGYGYGVLRNEFGAYLLSDATIPAP